MLNNKLPKGNAKPVTGKIPEVGKSTGNGSIKINLASKPVAGDKPEMIKPVADNSAKSRIEAARGGKQQDVIKPGPDKFKSKFITPTANPAAGQTPAAYSDVKPIIK